MRNTAVSKKLLLLFLPLFGACSPGPDYVRPTQETPPAFKQAGEWKPATTALAAEEKWWQLFRDPVLDGLEARVNVDNQNLQQAEAQYRVARAGLDSARAGLFPSLTAGAARTRSDNSTGLAPGTNYSATASLSWEIDLWGRLRRNVDSGVAKLAASAADLAAARLSTQALLAQSYAQLRATDQQLALLVRTVSAYRRFLELTDRRLAAGVASPLDQAQAQTQLATAQAQEIDLQNSRAQTEHALAVLTGRPPAAFSLPAAEALPQLPATPRLLPSTLIEQRPDIIAAEMRVAAANAQIGVASAAWFPVLSLGGAVGYRNPTLSGLFDLPNRFWSLGPNLAMTLFDGGARSAALALATASYEQTVASYRQTVLTAFQEVEDNLAASHLLEQEAAAQARAMAAAKRAREIAEHQYRAGTINALNVVTAQAAELSAEVSAIAIANRRLQAAIQLQKNAAGRLIP